MVFNPSFKVKIQIAQVVLITPFWKAQSWLPIVLELLEDYPQILPIRPDLVMMPGVSNEAGSAPTDHLAYLRQCYSSQGFSSEALSLMLASWRLETRPTPTMVPPLLNGLAGVTSGVEIPLQDLRHFVT